MSITLEAFHKPSDPPLQPSRRTRATVAREVTVVRPRTRLAVKKLKSYSKEEEEEEEDKAKMADDSGGLSAKKVVGGLSANKAA